MDKLRSESVNGDQTDAFDETASTVKNATLAAGVAESIAVPSGATVVYIVADQDIWYNLDSTAAVPTDDSTDHRYFPVGIERGVSGIKSIANISVLSPSIAHVSARFWGVE